MNVNRREPSNAFPDRSGRHSFLPGIPHDRSCRRWYLDEHAEVEDLPVPATQLDPDLEAQLRSADLTYNDVGRTSEVLPDGYHHLNRRIIIGLGTTPFVEASQALLSWQMHLRSGLTVATSSATVTHDAVVMLGIGAGPFRVSAPCRVVYIIDEPNRQGFAYGTLPGHPESGEEAFVIEHADDDTVCLGITAFSRPASQLTKLAGPLGRLAQRRMTGRYLRSLTAGTQHRG